MIWYQFSKRKTTTATLPTKCTTKKKSEIPWDFIRFSLPKKTSRPPPKKKMFAFFNLWKLSMQPPGPKLKVWGFRDVPNFTSCAWQMSKVENENLEKWGEKSWDFCIIENRKLWEICNMSIIICICSSYILLNKSTTKRGVWLNMLDKYRRTSWKMVEMFSKRPRKKSVKIQRFWKICTKTAWWPEKNPETFTLVRGWWRLLETSMEKNAYKNGKYEDNGQL